MEKIPVVSDTCRNAAVGKSVDARTPIEYHLPMPPSNPRSIASLTISFGLVAIPVKLYSATISSERISFNLLRQKDGSRVKQQYISETDQAVVPRSEMVKGYEFEKDRYDAAAPK